MSHNNTCIILCMQYYKTFCVRNFRPRNRFRVFLLVVDVVLAAAKLAPWRLDKPASCSLLLQLLVPRGEAITTIYAN